MRRFAVTASLVALLSAIPQAQTTRPKATLTPRAGDSVRAGETVRLLLDVTLPAGLHVQANKPRDPSLIPTVLTVTPVSGVAPVDTTYPQPTTFKLSGSSQVLDVYGEKFSITVQVSVPPTTPEGDLELPARLRYQACDASSCFPPASETTHWTVHVIGAAQ